MLDDIFFIAVFSMVLLIGFFIGQHRNKNDIDIINENLYLYKQHLVTITDKKMNDFSKNCEVVLGQNYKLIKHQNSLAKETINNRIYELNKMHKTIEEMKNILKNQTEQYNRIIMLQKIIVKKKKLDN